MTHGHAVVSHHWRGKLGKNVVARKILKQIREQLEEENREILRQVAMEIKQRQKKRGPRAFEGS